MNRTDIRSPIFRRMGKQAQRGMTLIELIVVIAIVGMLGTGVLIGYMSTMEQSRKDTAVNEACVIKNAAMMYMLQRGGRCPTVEDLGSGGYLDSTRRTTDPWGNPYTIECGSESPDVYSRGPEGNERLACEKQEDD